MRLFVATMAVASAGLATPAGALSAAETNPAGTSNPQVVWGGHDGPQDVHESNTYGKVASLAVPVGRWFITAKGYVQSTPSATITCQLVAGADAHAMETSLIEGFNGGGLYQSLVLMITHQFTSPGTARLRCKSAGPEVGASIIRFIRMTAMKVGRLTTSMNGGSETSTGSGQPAVRAVGNDMEVLSAGDGVFHDVATLSLPAGLWWITAGATVRRNTAGGVTCRLETPIDYDDSSSAMTAFHYAPMNLQVTHRFQVAGAVKLRCQADITQYVTGSRIVAVRAGHLINRQFGGAEYNEGSGTPLILSSFHDDGGVLNGSETVLDSLALPAGAWLLSAKLYLDAADANGYGVQCKLSAGSMIDQVNETLNQHQISIVSLLGAHAFGSSGGTAQVTCRILQNYPVMHAYWIKLTAIKASSLTKVAL